MTQISSWGLRVSMLRKSAIFLVGVHWGIYWVLWTQPKGIAYNEKSVHLQIGLCNCQYLRPLSSNRQWTNPLVINWPSNNHCFWSCEVNCWVKSYLPDGLILSVLGAENIVLYKTFIKTIILYQFSWFFLNSVDIIKTIWPKSTENFSWGKIYEVNFNKFHKSFRRFPAMKAFLDRTKPKNCVFLRFQNWHLQ